MRLKLLFCAPIFVLFKNTPSGSKHVCKNKIQKKGKKEKRSQGARAVVTMQDYDVRCLLKEKTFLTKMNEWYWALAWQTTAEVSPVFYDSPVGPYLP